MSGLHNIDLYLSLGGYHILYFVLIHNWGNKQKYKEKACRQNNSQGRFYFILFFFILFIYFFFFETDFLCVALSVVELTL